MVIAGVGSTAKLAGNSTIGGHQICLFRDCKKQSELTENGPGLKGQVVQAERDRQR